MNLKQYIRKAMDSLSVFEDEDTSAIYVKVAKKKVGEWKNENLESPDGKLFYFPTNAALTDYNPDEQIMFNPIGEEKRGADTESYKLLCRLVGNNIRTYATATALAVMGSVTKCDKVADKRMSKFVSKVTEIARENGKKIEHVITEETLTKFKRLLKKAREAGEYPLLLLASKRQFEKGSSVYNRGVTFKFPLHAYLKETLKPDIKVYNIFGIEMSKYQLQLYIAVLELVILGAEDTTIDFVSNDKNFPSFIALMSAYREMMVPMTKVFKDISKKLTEAMPLNFKLDFLTEEELNGMKHLLEEIELVPSEVPKQAKRRSSDEEPIKPVKRRDEEPIRARPQQRDEYPYGRPSGYVDRDDRNMDGDAQYNNALAALGGGRANSRTGGYTQQVIDNERRYYDQAIQRQQGPVFSNNSYTQRVTPNPFDLNL